MGLIYLTYGLEPPTWLFALIVWTGVILALSILVLLLSPRTRRDAVLLAAGVALMVLSVQWVFQYDGLSRLLVAPIALAWAFFTIYFRLRLGRTPMGGLQRIMLWALIVTLVVNLALDCAELVKYAAGERALPAPAPLDVAGG